MLARLLRELELSNREMEALRKAQELLQQRLAARERELLEGRTRWQREVEERCAAEARGPWSVVHGW